MRHQDRTVEQVLAAMASCAEGLVDRPALLAAGVTPAQIRSRLASGLLIREHRGIYRVGHRAPRVEATYLGAVRACGSGAVLSGRAAGYLLGLLKGPPPPPEVTAPTERRVPGVITRRSRRMHPAEATTWRSIAVTSVPRTLVDLAATLSADDLALACHEAGGRHKTTPADVERVLARHPRVPGAGKLRAVLCGDVRVLLSQLERGFVKLLRKADLPLPETNRPAGGRRVDCRWPADKLTAELDSSYQWHNSRHSWEADRRREREAYARGDQFRRYTWGDVFEDSTLMMAELHGLLGATRPDLLS